MVTVITIIIVGIKAITACIKLILSIAPTNITITIQQLDQKITLLRPYFNVILNAKTLFAASQYKNNIKDMFLVSTPNKVS